MIQQEQRNWLSLFNYYLDVFLKKKHTYVIVIFLIVASCAVFSRIANNDFINQF